MTLGHSTELDLFRITPDPNRIYFNAGFRSAAERIAASVRQHACMTLVLGEPGIGKTTLLSTLRRELQKLRVPASFVTFARVPFDSLLKLCLEDFGLPAKGGLDAHINSLRALFASRTESSPPAVIIIDDAQYCSDELFAGLVRLLDADGTERLGVHLVLSGEPALQNRALPPALCARVADRIELHRLGRTEIDQYIASRLGPAQDRSRQLFVDNSLQQIADYSRGVPRIINQICGRALLLARVDENGCVTPSIASQAIGDYDAARAAGSPSSAGEIADLAKPSQQDTPIQQVKRPEPPRAPDSAARRPPPTHQDKEGNTAPLNAGPKPSSNPSDSALTHLADKTGAPPGDTPADTSAGVGEVKLPQARRIPRFSGFVPRHRMPIRTMAGNDAKSHRWDSNPPSRPPHLRVRLAIGLTLLVMTVTAMVGLTAHYWPNAIPIVQTRLSAALESGADAAHIAFVRLKERLGAMLHRDMRT